MLHSDEARQRALDVVSEALAGATEQSRAVLIDDLFGRLRVVLWAKTSEIDPLRDTLDTALRDAAGPYWTGEVWEASRASKADRLIYERAWQDGHTTVAEHVVL